MKKCISYLKKDAVLTISAVLAIVSSLFVLPDKEYFGYVNYSVIAILFSLMLVVSGFRNAGLFDLLTRKICSRFKSEKAFIVLMTMICFFSSAVVTNDIALITFVPFTLAILSGSNVKTIIFAVTAQTVAANLGSLITPVGNPQNLFLYTHYSMTPAEFFSSTLPLGLICLVVVTLLLVLFKAKGTIAVDKSENMNFSRIHMVIFSFLFVLCILSVFEVVHYCVPLVVVSVVVFIIKKEMFAEADYNLLITFVCFFVFVGNMSRIDAVYDIISKLITGRELVFSALISQVISNVPAATMLSSFTQNADALVLGTNIGGLGTLIASMASLISYRYICTMTDVKPSKYVLFFTVVNFILLACLLGIYSFAM